MMLTRIKRRTAKLLGVGDQFPLLRRSLIELDNVEELRKVFGWKLEPVLDDPSIYEFDSIEDINQRRVRDWWTHRAPPKFCTTS